MGKQYVKWDITSRCNLRCRHCSVGKTYFQDGQAELPLSGKLAVVETLAEAGVQAVSLLGGDPLMLSDDIFAVCGLAVKRGMKVSLVTNGLLLTGETADRLLDCGLERIVVSLDGARPETHEFIRGANTFVRVTRNIAGLVESIGRRRANLRVNVNTVLNQRNFQETPALIDLCLALGVHEWTPLSLVNIGFAENDRGGLSLSAGQEVEAARLIAERLAAADVAGRLEIQVLFTYPLVCDYIQARYGLSLPKPRICCSAAIGLGFVSPNGSLYPCDRIATEPYRNATIGGAQVRPLSLLEHSFNEAFNSDYFRNMFAFIARDETYRDYVPCRRCGYFRTRFCNPCPLYSLDSKVVIGSCLMVERELGDISGTDGTAEDVPALAQAPSVAAEPARTPTAELWSLVPSKTAGLRWVERGEALLILDPYSVEVTSLNLSGRAVWELIDGRRTAGEIAAELQDVAAEVGRAVPGCHAPDVAAPLAARIAQFFQLLSDTGLISMGGTARSVPLNSQNEVNV